jgi:hypothetical protein
MEIHRDQKVKEMKVVSVVKPKAKKKKQEEFDMDGRC